MATGGNSSDTCSICTEKFNKPKLLPCFHTFCFDCLEQFVSSSSKDGKILCPMCRYQVTLPDEGVAGFQTNFYIEARAGEPIHSAGESCVLCEQNASHTCRECEMLLCDTCTKGHTLIPSTKTHLLINLHCSDSDTSLMSMQRFCEKHVEEKLRFYCKRCDKVICRDCKLTDHEGHKTTDICDVVEQARTGLLKTKVKLEKYKTEIDEKLENLNRKNTDVSEIVDKTKTTVNEFAASVGKMIHSANLHQISRLTDIENMQKKGFTHEQETLSQRKCFIQSQIDHSDAMLKEGIECDIITTGIHMKQRLYNLEKEHSIFSDSDDQLLNTQTANSSQMNVISCFVNDIFRNLFPVSYQVLVPTIIRTIKYKSKRIHSICFTKTKQVWISQGDVHDGLCLCLFYIPDNIAACKYRISVRMDQLEEDGVHGVITKYNENEEIDDKIPVTEINNLKKGFMHRDTNTLGDRCKVDHEYNAVMIKSVNGDCRILTFNPFAKQGQQFKPVDVCWGDNQEVYIIDSGSRRIIVYNLYDGFLKSYSTVEMHLNPTAIAMDNDGNIWVGDDVGNVHICNL